MCCGIVKIRLLSTPQPQVCMPNNPFPHGSVVSLMTGGSEHLAVNHPACVLPHPPAAQTAHRGPEWHQVPHLRTLDLRLTICCLCCSCQSLGKKRSSPLGTSSTSHPAQQPSFPPLAHDLSYSGTSMLIAKHFLCVLHRRYT